MIIRQGGGDWSVVTRTVAWRIKRVPCLRRKVHAWPCGPEQHIPPPSNAEPHLAFWDWWKGQACPGPPTIPVTAQPLLCLQYPDRSSLPCLYRVCDTPPLSSSSQRLLFQPPSPPYPTFQFPALVNNPLHNTTVPLAPRSCMHRTGMLTSSPVPLLLLASVWCVQMPPNHWFSKRGPGWAEASSPGTCSRSRFSAQPRHTESESKHSGSGAYDMWFNKPSRWFRHRPITFQNPALHASMCLFRGISTSSQKQSHFPFSQGSWFP